MRTISLQVGRLEFVGSGKFLAGVRNCRDDLRKGDQLHIRKNGEVAPPDAFRVDESMFFNRAVDFVSPGCTACLFFPNSLASLLRLGDELHGQFEDLRRTD